MKIKETMEMRWRTKKIQIENNKIANENKSFPSNQLIHSTNPHFLLSIPVLVM